MSEESILNISSLFEDEIFKHGCSFDRIKMEINYIGELECIVCFENKQILLECSTCQKHLCKDCFEKLKIKQCPNCRKINFQTTLIKNSFTEESNCNCFSNSCPFEGTVEELKEHVKICYYIIICACEDIILIENLNNHIPSCKGCSKFKCPLQDCNIIDYEKPMENHFHTHVFKPDPKMDVAVGLLLEQGYMKFVKYLPPKYWKINTSDMQYVHILQLKIRGIGMINIFKSFNYLIFSGYQHCFVVDYNHFLDLNQSNKHGNKIILRDNHEKQQYVFYYEYRNPMFYIQPETTSVDFDMKDFKIIDILNKV